MTALKLAASLGYGLSPSEAVWAAKKTEAAGYEFVWVPESVDTDAFATLGAMAAQTSRIGLGTGIVNVYSRTPTQLAMAAATMEDLSSGRFTLGIGASSRGVVSTWHGLEFADQLRRVESCIEVLRKRLRPGVEGARPPFSSVRVPVEIVVAGVLDRMILLAKERADGVLFFMRRTSEVRKASDSLASRTFKVYANVVTCASNDSAAAERRARRTVAYYLTYGDSYRRLVQSGEGAHAMASKVRDTWLSGRVEDAAKLVPDDLLRELAIFGRPEECRRMIESEYAPMKKLSMLGLQFNPGERNMVDSLKQFCAITDGLKRAEPSNMKKGEKPRNR